MRTGVTFLLPKALIDVDVTEIAAIRVGQAEAAVLKTILEGIYEGQATITADIPVPAGTTDFSQFILGAQESGGGGAFMAIGEQEAVQVVRAGQQLGSDLKLGASLGTFSSELSSMSSAVSLRSIWGELPPMAEVPLSTSWPTPRRRATSEPGSR